MGKKHTEKPKGSVKSRNKHNLTSGDIELRENVDLLLKISTSVVPQGNIKEALKNQKELSELISKIKILESGKSQKSNPLENANDSENNYVRNSPEILASFTDWLKKNEALFVGCSIAEFPGFDLGLKADIDIPFGSLFIAVPKKIMLTAEAAKKSILKRLIENDHILKNMPNVTLAIYLLVEKYRDNSFYKPYIDILPRSYPTVLYFSMEELEELKGSQTFELALRQIKSISRQYAYFHTIFLNSDDSVSRLLRPHFTFEEYCWAVSTIMTRQNTIPSEDGTTKVTALIPLWDLCNHTNGKISTDYNPYLNRSECLAQKDFKANEQLFIFYGPRSNAEFFIHNGFVPDDNEYDSYSLKLGISKSDPLYEKRLQLLQRLCLEHSHEFCLKKGSETIDGNLLAFVRIFNMNEDQLNHWLESDKAGDLQYVECALDVALEKKSWVFLQTRLKLLLATYKTTLEEDLILLKNNDLKPHVILAIKMRVSEKSIISDTLLWLGQYIQQ